MKTNNQGLNCLEMKDRIQDLLWQEYEARKDEFDSYIDFIVETSKRDKHPSERKSTADDR